MLRGSLHRVVPRDRHLFKVQMQSTWGFMTYYGPRLARRDRCSCSAPLGATWLSNGAARAVRVTGVHDMLRSRLGPGCHMDSRGTCVGWVLHRARVLLREPGGGCRAVCGGGATAVAVQIVVVEGARVWGVRLWLGAR